MSSELRVINRIRSAPSEEVPKYPEQLVRLKSIFPDVPEEDILSYLRENRGDANRAAESLERGWL